MGATATIDQMLQASGGFGLYQYLLLVALSSSMFSIGLQILVMTFLSAEPPWHCIANSSNCNFTQLISSGSKLYSARCAMTHGVDWEYSTAFTSIVTEFDLYCGRAYLRRVATSLVYVGWFIGAVLFGALSDKFGRKRILFASLLVMGASALAGSFSNHVALFTALRLLVGSGIGGAMLITFVLSTEFSIPQKRGFAGTTLWFFTTFSLMVSALLAYLIRDWRVLSGICAAPGLLMLLLWWVVPESVRWLLTHGKIDEAQTTFVFIAKRNGVDPPQMKLEIPVDMARQRWGSFPALFRTKRITLYTSLSFFIWFTCALLYFGVSMSAGHLSADMYLNFFLLSIAEIPGNAIAIIGMNKFGRKACLIFGLFSSSVCLVTAALFPTGSTNKGYMAGRVTFAVLAKLCNLIAFDCSYVISAELFPTTLRNTGMGASSAFARIGAFISPYLLWLNEINRALPYVIMGGIAFLCACVSFLLPETNNNPTKETLADESDAAIDEAQLEDILGSGSNFSLGKEEVEKNSMVERNRKSVNSESNDLVYKSIEI